MGPVGYPLIVRSLTEYTATFGPRTAGTAMWDAAEFFLDNRGGELVVMRAAGPSAVKATVSLDSAKIVATAKNPGASYNSWTVAYTSAAKSITLVKGATTVVYAGTDAATLQAAVLLDPDVTVTVTSLPAADVAAANLATGTDDFANVVWATVLGLVSDTFGPGSIATPGVAFGTSGTALAAHAKATGRLALMAPANGQTRAQAVTAAGTVAAYSGAENSVLVWNEAVVPAGATGTKTIDPTTVAATLRGLAHRLFGPGTSPMRRDVAARLVTPITLANGVSSTDFTALVGAHVSFLRFLPTGVVGLDNWQVAVSANPNLFDAQFMDVINAAAADCGAVLERFVGRVGSAMNLAQVQAELEGALDAYRPWLFPAYSAAGALIHPGFRVTVNNGTNIADNRITAAVSLRLTESMDFFDFSISRADAGMTI